jgi:hypothetical protein
MLRRVPLVRTDVSEKRIASIIRVTSNVSSSPILVTLMMEAIRSSETSILKRTTRRNIPEDGIPQLCLLFIFVLANRTMSEVLVVYSIRALCCVGCLNEL